MFGRGLICHRATLQYMPGGEFLEEVYLQLVSMLPWYMDVDIGIKEEKCIVWTDVPFKKRNEWGSTFNTLKGCMWSLVMKAVSLPHIATKKEKEFPDSLSSSPFRESC